MAEMSRVLAADRQMYVKYMASSSVFPAAAAAVVAEDEVFSECTIHRCSVISVAK
jgi:hypothetical protein